MQVGVQRDGLARGEGPVLQLLRAGIRLGEDGAGVRPLPEVSAEVFEGMVAGRNLLLVDDLLEQQNADLRAFIPEYTESSVRRLRAWLETGRYRRDVPA